MTDISESRAEVLEWLRSNLIGPLGGPEESVADPPNRKYAMGVLYPQEPKGAHVANAAVGDDPIFEQDDAQAVKPDEFDDVPVVTADSWMPSSCGLSLYFSGDPVLQCEVAAAVYARRPDDGAGSDWIRSPLPEGGGRETVKLSRGEPSATLFDGRAELTTVWREVSDGWLVTCSLVNPRVVADRTRVDAQECIYQVELSCSPTHGSINEYPEVEALSTDPEEEDLRLVFRNHRTFAAGHNTSVRWEPDAPGARPDHVCIEFLPSHEVPAVTPELSEGETSGSDPVKVLDIGWLAAPRDPEDLMASLGAFLDHYAEWISGQIATAVPGRLEAAKGRLIGSQQDALERMRAGVAALDEPDVADAFRLANQAMALQMRPPGERSADVGPVPLGRFTWRPFQLAFQLLVLRSLADPDHPEREDADLLWFPTGGGKTEAYLAVAALEIFLRRLRKGPSGGGLAVITRYTLRLLTSQQFQRTAGFICAAELIRRGHDRLGDEPITLGLWVGEGVLPNNRKKAREWYERFRHANDPRYAYPFQLDLCPWCAAPLVPDDRTDDDSAYGVSLDTSGLHLNCTDDGCAFHPSIPVKLVDEDIYDSPPTFLVATVDKFARLPWVSEAARLFPVDGSVDPPSLIIQDELHLLSGPLGSVFGVYEAAIDTLLWHEGRPPKVVASTATIRHASEQVRGLFARDVHVFPPTGLSSDNSFFARTDHNRPGRLYAGVLAPAHSPSYALSLVSAPLLYAPLRPGLDERLVSSYWTLVIYHNSLRELGRTLTIARDDIPSHLASMSPGKERKIEDDDVVELTGNLEGPELARALRQLEAPRGEDGVISVLACTNMLSVGVDVPRLGLMLVVGQPKTSAEYIQATSRVGRDAVPGLVVAMLGASKPRDRSHYEGFIGFHQALYRHVEPTSVTPFADPVRRRALHAALVTVVRHGARLDEASTFSMEDPRIRDVIERLAARIAKADPAEADSSRRHLDCLIEEWTEWAADRRLMYTARSWQFTSLLVDFGSKREGWETLSSMRSVDLQVPIDV